MTDMPTIRPIGDGFVAEIAGVDFRNPLGDAAIEWIAGRLDDFAVLVFRGQRLDAPALDRFACCFGKPRRGSVRANWLEAANVAP
jgi:alpha-ketoglutarate-dependent taurine dioxygenase